jgi:hypothetical protein
LKDIEVKSKRPANRHLDICGKLFAYCSFSAWKWGETCQQKPPTTYQLQHVRHSKFLRLIPVTQNLVCEHAERRQLRFGNQRYCTQTLVKRYSFEQSCRCKVSYGTLSLSSRKNMGRPSRLASRSLPDQPVLEQRLIKCKGLRTLSSIESRGKSSGQAV